jgi:putative cell wall-binding protein
VIALVRRRRSAVALLVGTCLVLGTAVAHADTVGSGSTTDARRPSQWPASTGFDLRIDGWPNAVRFSGADRYQTGLTAALALRGKGSFPFDTPDRSSGGAATLAAAKGWWGVGVCPRSIIVVAADSPADALSAAALSDPTHGSSEPYLQRSAAADPLFNPVGGFAKVDTDSAPVLVTQSTRSGATALSAATKIAAQDLRSGGCTQAFQAIIVGGANSVPSTVETELVAIGYDEVFRVFGDSRYDTAAKVAQGLGTAPIPSAVTGCTDTAVDDGTARMAFVANSVVEYRPSATQCQLLGRTVLLADGVTGADALAAGWWTSFFQVPVLLHNATDTLPPATANALRTMQVQNIIVLGGTSRISDAVVAQAVGLTGATALRIAGTDRYDTSVQMAKKFGGWYPTGRANEFEGSMVCVASSSGDGASALGWADALGAGPWCAAANGAASNPGQPARALAPLTGQLPALSTRGLTRPAHDAVPILLVPVGASTLPSSLASLLGSAFEPADTWCTSVSAIVGCHVPGFAVGFGGESAVNSTLLDRVSQLVSGGAIGSDPQVQPTLVDPFFTALDMSPVFGVSGSASGRICVARGNYTGARWLGVFDNVATTTLLGAGDVMFDQRYQRDADGVVRSRRVGAPVCTSFDPGTRTTATAQAVGLSGRASTVSQFKVGATDRFVMAAPVADPAPTVASGIASDVDTSGAGSTVRTYITTSPTPPVGVVSRGVAAQLASAAITVTLVRGTDSGGVTAPDLFTATWSLTTPLGLLSGTASGEALFSSGQWQLRGRSDFAGGSWNVASGSGGFRATISTNVAGLASDDAISWQLDGLVAG